MSTKQTVPMRKAKALKLIRKHAPSSPAAFVKLGFRLNYIGAGVFREVARIAGCDLVVKFPLDEKDGPNEGIAHSLSEMKRIEKLSRVPELKPHMPKVFYYDRKNGIIVMQFYPELTPADAVELLGKVVRKLVAKVSDVAMTDIHDGNVRRKRKGWDQLVFTDLGY